MKKMNQQGQFGNRTSAARRRQDFLGNTNNFGSSLGNNGRNQRDNFANLLLWFIGLTVLAGALLWLFHPTGVQVLDATGRATGQIDFSKLLLWAIVGGLIALLIIYLLMIFIGNNRRNQLF